MLRETISNFVDRGSRKILLNLGGVTNIDADGLRDLVTAAEMTDRYGGRLKFLNLPGQYAMDFNAANAGGSVEAFRDERAAVVSFATVRSSPGPVS